MESGKYNYEWNLKETEFKKNKGTVFSCFACGGGSTMGYKLAGLDVLGCNEIDPKMMDLYIENHKPKYSFLEGIQSFKMRDDLPEELYNLDILDGSPPCSSFSTSGRRDKDWGKEKKFKEGQAKQVLDTLFFDFIDLAKKLQPKIVVAENVKGIILGKAKQYTDKILKKFDEAGYNTKYYLLDGANMGLPQSRQRVFFIGVRKDLIDKAPELDFIFNYKKIPLKEIYSNYTDQPITKKTLYLWENRLPADKGLDNIHYRFFGKKNYFNFRLVKKDDVVKTISSMSTHILMDEPRFLNKTELLRASSFPNDYNFKNIKPVYVMGMSVPPIMTANIADIIIKKYL